MAANDKKLLYKIAKAYYEENLTQEKIGRRLGLSRMKISRLLQQARDEKVVQIMIIPPPESKVELERELETLYGLDEVIIVSPSSDDPRVITRELALPTVDWLLRILQGDEVLTLSWGTTLRAVVDAFPLQYWPDMKVVQMLGGLGQPESETYGGDLVHRMAQACNGRPRIIPAPGVVKSRLVHEALMTDPQIADTLALAAKADIALVGIGRPTASSVVVQSGILTDEELAQLRAQGAVGDIALRFFDVNGQPVQHEIYDRLIGLELDQLKKIPRVIGVAGGEGKFEVIRAALRGKLVNVLVTDERIALWLLQEAAEPSHHAPGQVAVALGS